MIVVRANNVTIGSALRPAWRLRSVSVVIVMALKHQPFNPHSRSDGKPIRPANQD
jgi:hypothetical protein